MKWCLIVVVLVIAPFSVYAERPMVLHVTEHWREMALPKPLSDTMSFAILSNEDDLHSVRGTFRFYLRPDMQLDQIQKTRCGVFIGREKGIDLSKHLIAGQNGPDLWYAYIPKNTVTNVFFYGEQFPVDVIAAKFHVTSSQGDAGFTWIRGFPLTQKWIYSFAEYQEATLPDLCQLDG